MKVLITGRNGQLGRCLQDRIAHYDFEVVTSDSATLDITDQSAVLSFFIQHKPDLVINAAAYTAVDKAETEQQHAMQVNTEGPANLAGCCSELDIPLIHISTDYVFDGLGNKPYRPDDCAVPQSVYGETKLNGEHAVVAAMSKYVIIRTAWVFSEYGHNFMKSILSSATRLDLLTVVADQYGCPTYAGDLADAILKIVAQIEADDDWLKYGIYHFCGEEATSWHGFARAIIAEAFQLNMIKKKTALLPIATKDYPTSANRPEYSVMDCSDFPIKGVERNWRNRLVDVLNKLSEK